MTSERLGFIGLGIMGRPMAGHLVSAGYPVTVHSRSPGPVDELVALGASRADDPAAVAAASDVVILMLPDTPDVESVVDGDRGLAAALPAGALVIDMSTIDPVATRRIAADLAERGVGFVDAPVSGGQKGAIDATLSIMIGGEAADVRRATPILETLGKSLTHVGGSGAGQITKAANQLVVAMNIEAVAEALALAEAAGVDAAKVREALLGGFAASRVLEVHGQRMLDRTFTPGFRIRLHRKDARIIEETAVAYHARTPAFAVVAQRLQTLVDDGHGELDHSGLYLGVGTGEPTTT
jgi:2-hydroxy-3-oxopropionate reductase